MTRRPSHFRIFAIILCALFAWEHSPAQAAAEACVPTRRRRATITTRMQSARDACSQHSLDPAKDDVAEFDDPIVRQAAVEALGRYNGSVVAIDPSSGRILSIVNQKLAFSSGFIPCSTIKPVIAVAALQEGVVTRDTMIRVAPRKYLNLTEALAHSNNAFFEELGRRMGFETVSHYGRLLGLGELAGYQIPEEHPGGFPDGAAGNRRRGADVELRRGNSDDAVATGRAGFQHRQWRHAVLPAISADRRKNARILRRA